MVLQCKAAAVRSYGKLGAVLGKQNSSWIRKGRHTSSQREREICCWDVLKFKRLSVEAVTRDIGRFGAGKRSSK